MFSQACVSHFVHEAGGQREGGLECGERRCGEGVCVVDTPGPKADTPSPDPDADP